MAKVHQVFSSHFKQKLGDYNLTPQQFGVLAYLWKQDGISQIQLGDMTYKDRTTISGIIDRLEKEGLVTRRDDPGDRRANLIFLTPKGAGLQDALVEIALSTTREVTHMLTEKEKEQLRTLLTKILLNTRPNQDKTCS
ncbi:MarR family transcriptional regulator [Desulfallas sp. Bu1-1]|uniref:MarR family winged helix-turn-helix transcriptional regulator n=1 Tax=Desulfallas sp. Bu1-1 TaxID=2787620 RepID=UPI0028BE22CB|nr:MarR family transcriptional regulator [Desulfallas sp. Bu1-1]